MNNGVNNDIYDELGERWYTANDDPVALLRAEARTRNPWVLETIAARLGGGSGVDALDVGCGGGFLTNALARAGHRVTGVDLSKESLEVARRHDATRSVRYVQADAYGLPFDDSSFDVVSAMDFLEHVEDPARAIAEMSRVLRPGGLFFFHTFNRNPIAAFVVIRLVEWFVPNTPKHLHVSRLFVKPSELRAYCARVGLSVVELRGLRPRLFSLGVLRGFLAGAVPPEFGFSFVKSPLVAYCGFAVKAEGGS